MVITEDFSVDGVLQTVYDWTRRNGSADASASGGILTGGASTSYTNDQGEGLPADQFASCIFDGLTANNWGAAVRVGTAGTRDGYALRYTGGSARLLRIISGATLQIGTDQAVPSAGTIFRVEARGTIIRLRKKEAGERAYTTIIKETNSDIADGKVGILANGAGGYAITYWEGGPLSMFDRRADWLRARQRGTVSL